MNLLTRRRLAYRRGAKSAGWTAFCILLPAWVSAAEPLPELHFAPVRDFGYVIGDRITLSARLKFPGGCQPLSSSLPGAGAINYWLRLDGASLTPIDSLAYRLDRVYQTFYAPLEVKRLTIPSMALGYRCGGRTLSMELPPWNFTMAPIRPWALGKEGVDDYLRPDRMPPLPSNRAHYTRLVLWLGLLSCAGIALAWALGWLPGSRRSRPFAVLYRTLRGISGESLDGESLRGVFALVHDAFNRSAGQPLFAEQLDDFFAARPSWQPLRGEIEAFFRASYVLHFAPDAEKAEEYAPARLLGLVDACRKLERLA